MALTADDLTPLIGTPPTAQGIAAAILFAISPPVPAVPDPPADHGLDPNDPAVTGIPRDETVPTAGIDLPPDPSTIPAEPPSPVPEAPVAGEDTVSAATGDDSISAPADDPLADAIAADETKLATDEADVTADEAQLAADQAKRGK